MSFTRSSLAFVLTASAALGACTSAPPPAKEDAPAAGYGETKESSIEVCMPAGEREYLSRLVCPDGESPEFRRVGSYGSRTEMPSDLSEVEEGALIETLLSGAPLAPGDPDYHVVDGYEVNCKDSERFLFLDMYHCHQPPPDVAPRGFTLSAST